MMKKLRSVAIAMLVGIGALQAASAQTYGNLYIQTPRASVYVTTPQPRYHNFPRYWSEGYARSSNHWVPYYAPSYSIAPGSRSPHYNGALRQSHIGDQVLIYERQYFNGYPIR